MAADEPGLRQLHAGVTARVGPAPAWRGALLAAAMLAFLLLPSATGHAVEPGGKRSWPAVKCERYREAWTYALARRGNAGLGQAFLDSHQAFLASGCTARADVCPRSAAELELANVLTVLAMNAGTASTFLPFACRP